MVAAKVAPASARADEEAAGAQATGAQAAPALALRLGLVGRLGRWAAGSKDGSRPGHGGGDVEGAPNQDAFKAFLEVQKARREAAKGASKTLFLSHCWRNVHDPSVRLHKMEIVTLLSAPEAEGGAGLTYWADWLDLQATGPVPWRKEIEDGIKAAAKVVCLIDSEYLQSFNCLQEIAFAELHNKPLVVIIQDQDGFDLLVKPDGARRAWTEASPGGNPPLSVFEGKEISGGIPFTFATVEHMFKMLSDINICFARDLDFAQRTPAVVLEQVKQFVMQDIEYLRTYASYAAAAADWDRAGRPKSMLLGSAATAEATRWLANSEGASPPPSALQRELIAASVAAARFFRAVLRAATLAAVCLVLVGAVVAAVMAVRATKQTAIAQAATAQAVLQAAIARNQTLLAQAATAEAVRQQYIAGNQTLIAQAATANATVQAASLQVTLLAALADKAAAAAATAAANGQSNAAIANAPAQLALAALLGAISLSGDAPALVSQVQPTAANAVAQSTSTASATQAAQCGPVAGASTVYAMSRAVGQPLLAGLYSDGALRIWNATIAGCTLLHTIPGALTNPTDTYGATKTPGISPDGTLVVVCGRVWEMVTGNLVTSIPQIAACNSQRFSADSQFVFGVMENTLLSFSAATGAATATILTAPADVLALDELAISPNQVVATSYAEPGAYPRVVIWDTWSGFGLATWDAAMNVSFSEPYTIVIEDSANSLLGSNALVAFAPDAYLLAVATSVEIRIYAYADGSRSIYNTPTFTFSDTRTLPYWLGLAFDDVSNLLAVCSEKGDVRMYSMVTGQPAFTLPAPVGLARIAYGVAFLPGSAALAVAQDIYSSASSYSGATGQVAGAVTVFGFTGAYSTLALNAAGSLANNLNQLAAAALAPLPAGGVAFLAANQSPYMCGLPLSITLQSGCGFDPNNGESVTVWDVSQPVNAPPGSMTLSDSLRVIGWRGVSEDGTAALLAATRASASLLLWQVTSGPQARLLTTSTCAACVDASDVRVLQAGSAWGRVIVVGPFSRPTGVPTFPPGSVGSGSALVQVFRSIASTAGSQPAVATLLVNFDIFPAVDYVGNANKRVSVALSTDGAYLAATEGRHTLALWQLDAATAAGGSVAAPQQLAPLLLLSWGSAADVQVAHFQVDFSPDGGWLTVLDDTGVRLFQVATLLEAAATPTAEPPSFALGPASALGSAGPASLAWSADSGQVFVGYADGTMRAFAAQATCQNGGLWPLGGTEVIDTGYVPTIVTAGGGWVAVTGTNAAGTSDLVVHLQLADAAAQVAALSALVTPLSPTEIAAAVGSSSGTTCVASVSSVSGTLYLVQYAADADTRRASRRVLYRRGEQMVPATT